METVQRTREKLQDEIAELRTRLEEAEHALRALGDGGSAPRVVSEADADQISLPGGAERPWPVRVETGNEGAVTLEVTGLTQQQRNAELEIRIADRTAELAASLRHLKVETAERLKAAETLREKEQMLIHQSRLAAMGEMLGNIAHQWRQPLNSLGLLIQEVQMQYQYGELSKDSMDQAAKSSLKLINHMSQTIEDFRNYFKPENTKVVFKLSKVISSTMAIVEGSFKHDNVLLEIDDSGDPVAYGYQNEFAQSILNILNNAKDVLTERKVPKPKVRIAVYCENDRAVITISDNAGGIPDDIMPKIFDPYFTTKGSASGTGIGLYMTKNIIEKKMGGKVSVRNLTDGAEFRIEVNNGTGG